ncbi:MAG: AAA family ATPase [Rhizomicrobium sp.]
MLAALTVRDIVLIETAALEFAPGLNVLTGETGAGKSILLDALGLAAGGRGGGRAGVRPGAAQGSATAVFEPPKSNPAFALLAEQTIPVETEIVLRRTLSQDGRTRAFVNDEPVGVALLRDVGAALLEVHGQADDRGLFDIATHRGLLDGFAGHDALLRETALAFAAFDGARKALADLKAEAATAAADADFIRHAAEELTALAPEDGEEPRLASERALLTNATRIAEDVNAAADLLAGDRGAANAISGALKRLSRMNEEARKAAGSAEAALDQAYNAVEDARRELETLQSRLDIEPGQLEKVEDRIHDLRAAARKYGVSTDALAKTAADFRFKRDTLSLGGGRFEGGRSPAGRAPRRVPGGGEEAFEVAQRRRPPARNRRCRRTGAAQARPCEIPRRPRTPGRRRRRRPRPGSASRSKSRQSKAPPSARWPGSPRAANSPASRWR